MVRLGRLSISVPQLLWSRLGLIANAWTEHWRTDLQGWTLQEWTLTEEVCVMLGIDSRFLQRAQCSHCKRCISYSNSVCPSVRPSHAGILSKRPHVARCSLHRWIAKCVQFCRNQKIFPRHDPFPLKFWLQVTCPLLKAASFDTFCLVAPQP